MTKYLATFVFSIVAQANVGGPFYLQGKVHSFDEKTIVIDTEELRYEVPRAFASGQKLKLDQNLDLDLSQEQSTRVHIYKRD